MNRLSWGCWVVSQDDVALLLHWPEVTFLLSCGWDQDRACSGFQIPELPTCVQLLCWDLCIKLCLSNTVERKMIKKMFNTLYIGTNMQIQYFWRRKYIVAYGTRFLIWPFYISGDTKIRQESVQLKGRWVKKVFRGKRIKHSWSSSYQVFCCSQS